MAATHEWTPEQDALVRTLCGKGFSGAAIGKMLGIPRSTMLQHIRSLQLLDGMPITQARGVWPAEKNARLTELWDEGHSTGEIGRRMGISKCAVIGKSHRLGLPPRQSPIRRSGSAGPPRASRRPPVPNLAMLESLNGSPMLVQPMAAVRAPEPMPKLVYQITDAARTCQFIEGEAAGADTEFCGRPSQDGSSYCDWHHRLCHVRISRYEDVA